MEDDTRGQAFATASVPRNQAYLAEMYTALIRENTGKRNLQLAVTLFVIAFCLWGYFVSRNPAMFFLAAGFVVFMFVQRAIVRWKWMRDRLADVGSDNEMKLAFYEDTLVGFTSTGSSEIDWQGMYKAVHSETGLLIYPARGAAFYIPDDCLEPASAIATVLQKVNQKKVNK